MKLFLAFLWCAVAVLLSSNAAGTRIGTESAVTTPTSAHYSTAVNFRPGDGDTVSNNPPIFSWFYNTNNLVGGEQNPNGFYPWWATQTNAFQFQIATQANFGGTLAVDVNTPFNFYNFLAPLNTNATRQFWWRVKYVTNEVAYCTSAIRTFTIVATATNWDRSLLASTNYMATNSVHPMFCYRAGEESAIWSYAQSDDARSFFDLTNTATAATNASWWHTHHLWGTNATPSPKYAAPVTDGYGRANNISAVLFLHRFSADARWTNASMTGWLFTNLYKNTHWFLNPSNNYAMQDYGDSESTIPLRLCIATYDWLYDYLGSDTGTFNGQLRTNALQAMRFVSRYWIGNDLWTATPYPLGTLVNYYDWNYRDRTNYCNGAGTFEKTGNSHAGFDFYVTMIVGFIGGEDDPEIKVWRDLTLNAMLARTSSFGGWAANHIGVYGYVDNHIYNRSLQSGLMILDVAYPQAQIRRTDFATRFPEWYTRMIPYGKRMYHGPYGDGAPSGNWGYFFGTKQRGWDLAALTGSGLARQLYDLNRESSNAYWGVSSHFDEIPTRYHFSLPAAATNTTAALYPEDGFVAASSKSPSEFDCYTNGVGFSFKASPRGNHQGHQIPDALSMDLWAYGAQVTDGGGYNLDQYGYHSDGSLGLFVNGYGVAGSGQAPYGYSQIVPLDASIVNYTNSGTNFVYCAGDATGSFTNGYHPLSNLVTKVRRDILFVRSKYWVVYDSFTSTGAAYFGHRWLVPYAFRYAAGGSPLANEHAFSANLFGSNSLVMGSSGFTYSAGNYADAAYSNPPRVPVHVHYVSTNEGTFVATGTNTLSASTASVIGTANTNSTLNPFLNRTLSTGHPDRSAGLWRTNMTAATNWHFMTVIVPQQPGVAAPIFTTVDDSTVIVTYDGFTDTNTFNTNYSGAYTFMVDVGTTNVGQVVSAVSRTISGATIRAGTVR